VSSRVQPVAVAVGAVLLAVGVLGLVPGVTTHYGDLGFAGRDSRARLLGMFQVSVLHDVAHVLIGIVGIALAKTPGGARAYLGGGGSVCLALWVLGAVGGGSWLPVNTADNWLHFVIGIGMIALGSVASRGAPRAVAV
jgi:hypothetical protein